MVKLDKPYGEGNHHRIAWRRAWDVNVEAMTATHRDSGFSMAFNPLPTGGYTAVIWCDLPVFGPDGELAMAQMFGLRELLKDGWDIWHTVARKKQPSESKPGAASVEGPEVVRLRREIRYLRAFGNNDCTKMADAAMERNELDD